MIFIGGLFKIEGRPFRAGAPPGSILGAKMEPKWRPGAYKIHKEFDAEIDPKIHRFFIDFGTHVGAQNGTKMVPKSIKKSNQKMYGFLHRFLDRFEHEKGLQRGLPVSRRAATIRAGATGRGRGGVNLA